MTLIFIYMSLCEQFNLENSIIISNITLFPFLLKATSELFQFLNLYIYIVIR
jgi:hypothetical protein